ncbi:hypothetical protein GCM10007863_11140 [Dyella mobilis]|nr:hypothetical protein GCM10007863_11140 [Dyella mobilis]
MTALATACGMFPLIWPRNLPTQSPKRWLVLPCVIAATFWLIFAAIDIRLTLPMWTNDTNLWRWALSMYPHDSQSRQNLLDAYLRNKDETGFRKLSITIIEDRVPCRYCLLLIARHAAFDNDDPVTASMALDKLNRIGPDVSNSPALQLYLMATGRTYLLQGRYDEAVRTFAEAVKTYPFDAPAQLSLANALALDGQSGPAREMGMIGIAMLPARQRSAALALLNDNISNGLARSAGVESGEKQQERAR